MNVCLIDDCGKPTRSGSSAWCEMHYRRWYRHGDPCVITCRRKSVVAYRTAHHRVSRARGPASSHRCVDCGEPAQQWAYNHRDPDERRGLSNGYLLPYSLDPMFYEPTCRSCHRLTDRDYKLIVKPMLDAGRLSRSSS